jgi:hypothetical protein
MLKWWMLDEKSTTGATFLELLEFPISKVAGGKLGTHKLWIE